MKKRRSARLSATTPKSRDHSRPSVDRPNEELPCALREKALGDHSDEASDEGCDGDRPVGIEEAVDGAVALVDCAGAKGGREDRLEVH